MMEDKAQVALDKADALIADIEIVVCSEVRLVNLSVMMWPATTKHLR